jgi:hypothetical protein
MKAVTSTLHHLYTYAPDRVGIGPRYSGFLVLGLPFGVREPRLVVRSLPGVGIDRVDGAGRCRRDRA